MRASDPHHLQVRKMPARSLILRNYQDARKEVISGLPQTAISLERPTHLGRNPMQRSWLADSELWMATLFTASCAMTIQRQMALLRLGLMQ
jgi:hypothetical protein